MTTPRPGDTVHVTIEATVNGAGDYVYGSDAELHVLGHKSGAILNAKVICQPLPTGLGAVVTAIVTKDGKEDTLTLVRNNHTWRGSRWYNPRHGYWYGDHQITVIEVHSSGVDGAV